MSNQLREPPGRGLVVYVRLGKYFGKLDLPFYGPFRVFSGPDLF